jgi:hypothetical protein
MPGDAKVHADLDELAHARLFTVGLVGSWPGPSTEELIFVRIASHLSHEDRVQLLAHESPEIRAYAIVVIANLQPDDLDAVTPLFEDTSLVLKGNSLSAVPLNELAHRIIDTAHTHPLSTR